MQQDTQTPPEQPHHDGLQELRKQWEQEREQADKINRMREQISDLKADIRAIIGVLVLAFMCFIGFCLRFFSHLFC